MRELPAEHGSGTNDREWFDSDFLELESLDTKYSSVVEYRIVLQSWSPAFEPR